LKRAELERERAHSTAAHALDRRLVVLEQRRHEIQSDVNKNVVAFRAERQAKETRREYDLSDPSGLRASYPARMGDDDPRTGPSGAQKFAGEDLDAGERRLRQTAQASQWYAEQAAAKEAKREEARASKAEHARVMEAQAQYQKDIFEQQQIARRAYATETLRCNERLALERREARAERLARDRLDEEAERLAAANDSFLNEDPSVAVSRVAPGRRVRVDHWKGASAEDAVAAAAARAKQRAAGKAEAARLEAAEADAARRYENTRRALEMNAERVEQFRAEQRASVLATVLGQRVEKDEADAAARAERYETGRFGEAYFRNFGSSHR